MNAESRARHSCNDGAGSTTADGSTAGGGAPTEQTATRAGLVRQCSAQNGLARLPPNTHSRRLPAAAQNPHLPQSTWGRSGAPTANHPAPRPSRAGARRSGTRGRAAQPGGHAGGAQNMGVPPRREKGAERLPAIGWHPRPRRLEAGRWRVSLSWPRVAVRAWRPDPAVLKEADGRVAKRVAQVGAAPLLVVQWLVVRTVCDSHTIHCHGPSTISESSRLTYLQLTGNCSERPMTNPIGLCMQSGQCRLRP